MFLLKALPLTSLPCLSQYLHGQHSQRSKSCCKNVRWILYKPCAKETMLSEIKTNKQKKWPWEELCLPGMVHPSCHPGEASQCTAFSYNREHEEPTGASPALAGSWACEADTSEESRQHADRRQVSAITKTVWLVSNLESFIQRTGSSTSTFHKPKVHLGW